MSMIILESQRPFSTQSSFDYDLLYEMSRYLDAHDLLPSFACYGEAYDETAPDDALMACQDVEWDAFETFLYFVLQDFLAGEEVLDAEYIDAMADCAAYNAEATLPYGLSYASVRFSV